MFIHSELFCLSFQFGPDGCQQVRQAILQGHPNKIRRSRE